MTLTTTSKDGTTIAYEVTGSGPALVLVDGAMCSREFGPARDVAKAVSGDYTVYVYDRRGRGESGNTLPYSPEREYEDLAAVVEAAGGDAYVMGQSSGAALALEAAAAGQPMRRLAVYEAPYVGQHPQKNYVAELEALIAAGRNEKAVGYFMVTMVGAPAFMPLMMKLMPKVLRALKKVAPTLPYDARILDGFEVPARFAKVAVPTLVMGGGKAKANMVRAVDGVAAMVPAAERVILDGQTHQVSPAALAPELIRFFS